jgi:hypothetical protein
MVVVPINVLQSLLREVQQLKGRVEALEGRADGIDNWTEKYSESFAYVAQKVKALESTEPKEPSQKVAAHLDEIVKALLAREKQCKNSGQKWDFMAFWGSRGTSRPKPSQGEPARRYRQE